MSWGVPVVASNFGGFAETIVDGKTGFLVDPKNQEAFTEKVAMLLTDSELWEKMHINSLERVKRYSPERIAQAYGKLYREMYKKSRGRSISHAVR